MNNLRSKEALILLLACTLVMFLIGSITMEDGIWAAGFAILGFLMCIPYFKFVLRSKPWDLLTSLERVKCRASWSFLVAMFIVLPLMFFAPLDTVDYDRFFSGAIGGSIIYQYSYSKKSETYLEVALKDGGPFFRGSQTEIRDLKHERN